MTISWALSWQTWTIYPSWTFDQNCLDMWPLEVHVKLSFSFPFNALGLRYSLLNIFISKTAWRSNGKKYRDFHLFLHIKTFPLLEGGEGSGGNCPHWVFIAPTLPSLWEGARQGGGQSLLRAQSVPHFISVWNWLSVSWALESRRAPRVTETMSRNARLVVVRQMDGPFLGSGAG